MEPNNDNFDEIVLLMLLLVRSDCCTKHGLTKLAFAFMATVCQLGANPQVYLDLLHEEVQRIEIEQHIQNERSVIQ